MRGMDEDSKLALETLHTRAEIKIEQIRRQLLPNCPAGISIEDLRTALFRRMDELPPEQRAELKVKAGIALIELNVMVNELSNQLAKLGREVVATKRSGQAINAYGQANRMKRSSGSSAW